MRIITGRARGKRLATLEGEAVRPTSDRVKESLFNIIQFDLEGQLGLEAVSRGAKAAVLVDSSKDAAAVSRQNVKACGFDTVEVIQADYAAYLLRRDQRFDIAFLDPPYGTGTLQKALPLTAAVMHPGGTIVCEHPIAEELPETAGDFLRGRTYRYGKVGITLYRHKDVMGQ